MKKLKYYLIAILLAVSAYSQQSQLTAAEFEKLSPQEAVLASHGWHRSGYATVVITPKEIIASFSKENKEVSIPLKDEFFISIAPWTNYTHECTNHVPTGCQGELSQKEMMIKIVDTATGDILKDETITTQKDGFIDLWLPKDKSFTVSFNYKGKTATEVLTTMPNSRTCITTMKLK